MSQLPPPSSSDAPQTAADAGQAAAAARPRRFWPVATALTAVAAITAGIFMVPGLQAQASNPPTPAQPAATPVSVATAQESTINAWDEFSGRLEAVERVDIRSRVAGAVQAVHFREGALVKQGDLLVTIDPAPYKAEVERAEAQVASAQARASYTRSEQARARRLYDEQAIAQRELDERLNAGHEAEANLRAAQASLQSARLNLSYTQVRAPVAGRIGKLEVTVGNLVAAGPGAPVLTTLVSVSPIYASFDVDEQVIGRALQAMPGGAGARSLIGRIPVQMGTVATEGTPFEGQLQLIDNQVDAKSGTVRVRATFDNKDGALIPGQFARIRMGQAQESRAVLVSERAVGTDQNKKFVMVVNGDNKTEYREVTLGAPVNGLRVVASGLKAGERVVVNGLQHVRPGALVDPQNVPMESAAQAAAARATRVASSN
ncbi:efflux RND transporter periplasmic adaptor subunit [Xenophilus sp. Marseille-Q4582]|uniref:efflux RND transporter periplasmic adaptor subunit n=1 Tax=Xenophilus sp. Marseille-Q4582 TaxID=2866600 RepID=UPI001CE3C1DC|nr:efflux RND transporter periplasmic adaptor subunit [Xenophilus sp. Marseille-Q4582]